MLHKELQSVIDDTVDTNWIVVIEGGDIIHFYESMESLKNGGEFISLVRSDDGEVVFMSSDPNQTSGTVDEIKEVLRDELF
jgi:hypothetical protein